MFLVSFLEIEERKLKLKSGGCFLSWWWWGFRTLGDGVSEGTRSPLGLVLQVEKIQERLLSLFSAALYSRSLALHVEFFVFVSFPDGHSL